MRLREKRKQMVVPTMPVHDENVLASIARHFVGCLLQQLQLQLGTVGHSSWLVFRFKDLTEVVIEKNIAYSCWTAWRTLMRSLPSGRCGPCFSMIPKGSMHVSCLF